MTMTLKHQPTTTAQKCTPKQFRGCKIGKVCLPHSIYCDKQANETNENERKKIIK